MTRFLIRVARTGLVYQLGIFNKWFWAKSHSLILICMLIDCILSTIMSKKEVFNRPSHMSCVWLFLSCYSRRYQWACLRTWRYLMPAPVYCPVSCYLPLGRSLVSHHSACKLSYWHKILHRSNESVEATKLDHHLQILYQRPVRSTMVTKRSLSYH